MRRRQSVDWWTDEFTMLAAYNGRVAQGIVHTPEYAARMARIQREYDAVQNATGGVYRATLVPLDARPCSAWEDGGNDA